MSKKISCLFSILLPLLVSVFCSRFDDTTGLGKDIINDVDPSLTNVRQNFLTSDCVSVDRAFSIPDPDDKMFGVHLNVLSVGTKDNVSASGYVEYTLDSTVWDHFDFPEKGSFNFHIDSILFRVDVRMKDSTLPSKLNVYASSEADSAKRTDQAKQVQLATLNLTDSSTYLGYANSTLIDSVKNVFSKYQQGIKSQTLSFCLYNDDTLNLVHLSVSPIIRIVARIENDSIKDTVKVTISDSYLNFVATENNLTALSEKPISSFASQRTAVFKLNISKILDTMNHSNFKNVLAAGFTITPKVLKNMNYDEDNKDTLNIVYCLSDTLYTDNSIFQTKKLISTKKMVSPTDSAVSADTLLLKYLEDYFNKSTAKPTVYLYVQLTTGVGLHWKEVQWNYPKFKAILTTLE